MKKSLMYAIGLQILIMLSVLIPPLVTLKTGVTAYLETERVDPRALFRGDYVVLDYTVGFDVSKKIAKEAYEKGSVVYVTVTTDRPGAFVSATLEKPEITDGQVCLIARPLESVTWNFEPRPRSPIDINENVGQFRESYVSFPQISQYFVSEGTGRDIERDLTEMVAKLKVTKGCKAVVRGLELL